MYAILIEPGMTDVGGSYGTCGGGEYPSGKCERDGGAPIATCNQSGTEPNRGIDIDCISTGGAPTGDCAQGNTPYSPVRK